MHVKMYFQKYTSSNNGSKRKFLLGLKVFSVLKKKGSDLKKFEVFEFTSH